MSPVSTSSDRGAIPLEIARFLGDLHPAPARLIVAVSGGPDSTALVHALANLPGRRPALVAVHVNHRLRGDASVRDAEWLADFCNGLGVPLDVMEGSPDADDVRHAGLEAAARSVRYRLLAAARSRHAADYIATAHTRSDQAETLLLRFVTGRGTWRLSGILPRAHDAIIRPMLRVPRSEVERYLREHGIEARHDESNDDSRFLRNRIRHELLPMVARWNPRIEELLADTASLELDRAEALDELMIPVRTDLVSESPGSATITVRHGTSPHILRSLALEQIRRLDPATREVDASTLVAIVEASPGTTRTISPGLEARRDEEEIEIRAIGKELPSRPYACPIRPGDTVIIPEAGFALSLLEAPAGDLLVSGDRMRQVIQIPPGSRGCFEIRSRRPGDRFRPLGMDRDKNLADFLIDRRIPTDERDRLPLLVCNDLIAWVAGVEVSDAFKVSHSDGRRLEVVAERIGGDR
jgi:tRNA(Ile)-lysidine synthase